MGGNFWADPDGLGFSQTHADRGDGICNATFLLDEKNVDYLPLAVAVRRSHSLTSVQTRHPEHRLLRSCLLTGPPGTLYPGTGRSGMEQGPTSSTRVHTYTGIGRYTVTLEVTGKNGDQGVLRRPALIVLNQGRVTGPNGMIWISSTPQNGVCIPRRKVYRAYSPPGIRDQCRGASDRGSAMKGIRTGQE